VGIPESIVGALGLADIVVLISRFQSIGAAGTASTVHDPDRAVPRLSTG
jgi:hypothetical protein